MRCLDCGADIGAGDSTEDACRKPYPSEPLASRTLLSWVFVKDLNEKLKDLKRDHIIWFSTTA